MFYTERKLINRCVINFLALIILTYVYKSEWCFYGTIIPITEGKVKFSCCKLNLQF